MEQSRTWRMGAIAALAVVVGVTGCGRRQAGEVNDIVPSISVSRARVPLGSAIEITYTWTVGPAAKKLDQDYRAFVHFLDSHEVMLFDDDHTPVPPATGWEPGKTYSYTRTKFVPIYPYVGDVEVRIGLHPASGQGERLALKAEDTGMREYRISKLELLPQTENLFLVYKEGWHGPESSPQSPGLERTWTKKEALVSFKNPKKDVVVYLEADTNAKVFTVPPVVTVSVGSGRGVTLPIESSEVFLAKIRFKAEDLGADEWVDLRLAMNESFVPKVKEINQDERELGLLVYHLYVSEADKLGTVSTDGVIEAAALAAVKPVAKPAAKPAKS